MCFNLCTLSFKKKPNFKNIHQTEIKTGMFIIMLCILEVFIHKIFVILY